ncbi:MAG TPA: methyltransferase domain-containing protein [Polyangiaceae bacterium]
MKSVLADQRSKANPAAALKVAPLHRVDDDAHLGQYIPLHYHGQMLANEQRMAPFHEAIDKLILPGSHVVELGGGTGVMSFLAAKHARKVTMVERLPHVAATARRLLAANGVSDIVTVVEADARHFVPDEPADVVICEMLHVALVREKQIEVLTAFKAAHQARFGRRVPRFIPEASILAVQPIFQPYDFHGYYAPVPFFFEAGIPGVSTVEMGQPKLYATIDYREALPESFSVEELLLADKAGTINALRFITKNPVGIFPHERRSADWYMPYMSLALPYPLTVEAGDALRIRFQYDAGASVESLQSSIQAFPA